MPRKCTKMRDFYRQKKAGTRKEVYQANKKTGYGKIIPTWHFPGGASSGKNLPANAGDGRDAGSTPGRYLQPLKKEMGTHSSILAWNIPWSERPGMLQSIGSQKSWA